MVIILLRGNYFSQLYEKLNLKEYVENNTIFFNWFEQDRKILCRFCVRRENVIKNNLNLSNQGKVMSHYI